MRSLRFLPLAYLAGVHGFAIFAPYLACAVAITHILWARRRRAEARLRREAEMAASEPAAASDGRRSGANWLTAAGRPTATGGFGVDLDDLQPAIAGAD